MKKPIYIEATEYAIHTAQLQENSISRYDNGSSSEPKWLSSAGGTYWSSFPWGTVSPYPSRKFSLVDCHLTNKCVVSVSTVFKLENALRFYLKARKHLLWQAREGEYNGDEKLHLKCSCSDVICCTGELWEMLIIAHCKVVISKLSQYTKKERKKERKKEVHLRV